MRISKKILAISLSILMAVSMMPFTVFAATTTVSTATEFETEIANATAGDTIKLSANIDLSSYAPKGMHRINITDLTIDLDGHTITTSGRWGVIFTGTNSTIKNGTMEALDNSDAPGYQYGIYVWGGDDANEMPDPAQKASATLENLTVNYGIHLYNSDVTIKNCNVTGSSKYYAVWADIEGTATIESGNFTTGGAAVVGTAQYQNTYFGHINIEGGNFTVPENKKLVQTGSSCVPENTVISGGTFENANGTAYTVPAINIADGAVEDANGVVTLLPTVTATDSTAEGYDTAYEYTYANDGDAKYANYYGDITVSFDSAIEAGDVVLAGAYDNYNSGNWNVVNTGALAANEEFRIVKDGLVGSAVKFSQLLTITGGEFRCAAKGVDVAGVTMTVKFNLYETKTSTEPIVIASSVKTYTFPEVNYVAEVNGVKYDTFEEALAAISTVTKATHSNAVDPTYEYKTYKANGTIKLLADTTSNGVIIDSGSNLTIDFNGKTLDINAKPVGSNGTESAAMQLLKDSDITFKDGTLTSSYTYASTDKEYIQRLIQNYADLTLNNMNVGMRGNFMNQMMMSNCNGNITITNSTISAPDFTWAGYTDAQAAESLGTRVMGVGSFSTAYPDVNVSVTNSTINGDVNIDITAAGTTAELTLNGSDVNGNIVDKNNNMNGATVKNIGSTVDGIPAGYEWNASNVLAPIADVFNLDITDSINMNMYINTEAYADDATIEVTYSTPELNDKTAKTTDTISASTLPRDSQNRAKLTVNAAPAQITDDVVINVKSGNQVVHTVTTSVRAYCEEIIAKSNDAELVDLAKTMLDYGKAANRSFQYTEASRFNYNNGEDYYDYYNGSVDSVAVLDKTGNNGDFASYSYIATTVPALRLYTNLSESQCGNADGVVTKATITNVTKGTTTQVAPVVVDLGNDNTVVAIDITGILAEDLADVYRVEYMDNTIELNAIQFAKAAKDTDRADFGRAMFNYYVAANAYFN